MFSVTLPHCDCSFRVQALAAALSGLLLAAAFPPLGWGVCGFFALVPLLLVGAQNPFRMGWIAGLFFFAPLLYWLNIVMTSYGGLAPFFSAVAWLILCAYLALFFALVLWLVVRLQSQRVSPLFSLPLLWVGGEALRGWLLSGFPWGLLGYVTIEMPRMRQGADLLGVYGLSLVVIFTNLTLTLLLHQPRRRSSWLSGLLCLLLLGLLLSYGTARLNIAETASAPTLRVGLVQGNIAQLLKWDPGFRQQTLDQYRRLSQQVANRVDLLIWPEAATPFYLQDQNRYSQQVTSLVQQLQTPLLVGSPAYEKLPDDSYRYYNSSYLLTEKGQIAGRSDKQHLVPFGEYVPLARYLFFINKLVAGVGDYSPGHNQPLARGMLRIGNLICYESIFPELARLSIAHGSNLLVNQTNDAWFGRSSAPWQLLDMTRMRAIENRIWIARAANTGISTLINPNGDCDRKTELFQAATVHGKVTLGAAATLYAAGGYYFSFACQLLLVATLVYVMTLLLLQSFSSTTKK